VIDLRPDCPVCGAVIGDAKLHQQFHDSLGEVARLALAPGMSPEEWRAATAEKWNEMHPRAAGGSGG
jgi:hypothetical protein